jgi:GAF domain-containing protein
VRAEIEAIAAAGEDMVSRLRRITGRVVQMLNVDVCGLYLLDPKRNELVLRAVSGVTMTSMDAIAIPVGSGTIGWVAKNLSPLVLRGTEEDKSPEGYQQVCVAVPIRYHTDLIGVFVVESTRNTPVDDERLDLIGTIASVIGQQIGESRAHEDSERRVTMLSALSELGVAFTAARERMSLAKLVTFSASTVLESDVSTIRLLREGVQTGVREPEFFELMASHGASISGPGDPLTDLEERVAREVLATSAPCRDLEFELSEVAPLMQRSNVSAVLGIPMLLGDELIGVITVYRVNDAKGKHFPFREEEIEIATRLGDYAAGAANRFVTPSTEEDEDGDEH